VSPLQSLYPLQRLPPNEKSNARAPALPAGAGRSLFRGGAVRQASFVGVCSAQSGPPSSLEGIQALILVQPIDRMDRRKSGEPLFGPVWSEDEIRSVEGPGLRRGRGPGCGLGASHVVVPGASDNACFVTLAALLLGSYAPITQTAHALRIVCWPVCVTSRASPERRRRLQHLVIPSRNAVRSLSLRSGRSAPRQSRRSACYS